MVKTTEVKDEAAEAKAAESSAVAAAAKTQPEPAKMKGTVTQNRGGRVDVRDTGLAHPDSHGRYVRVLKQSYINGAVFEPGEVTHWPEGVEVLGPNLEEVKR